MTTTPLPLHVQRCRLANSAKIILESTALNALVPFSIISGNGSENLQSKKWLFGHPRILFVKRGIISSIYLWGSLNKPRLQRTWTMKLHFFCNFVYNLNAFCTLHLAGANSETFILTELVCVVAIFVSNIFVGVNAEVAIVVQSQKWAKTRIAKRLGLASYFWW